MRNSVREWAKALVFAPILLVVFVIAVVATLICMLRGEQPMRR